MSVLVGWAVLSRRVWGRGSFLHWPGFYRHGEYPCQPVRYEQGFYIKTGDYPLYGV